MIDAWETRQSGLLETRSSRFADPSVSPILRTGAAIGATDMAVEYQPLAVDDGDVPVAGPSRWYKQPQSG